MQSWTRPKSCKIELPLRVLKFERKWTVKKIDIKKPHKIELGAKLMPSRRRPKSAYPPFFLIFLAAQVRCGSMDTPVTCGPHSPRPKDRLGLRNLDRVLAARLSCGSMQTCVACGRHSPRPKDRRGLGNLDTIKFNINF